MPAVSVRWSSSAITFEMPDNPGEPCQAASGTTTYISVFTGAGQSNRVTLQISG